jgi:hypothetical protein
MIANPTHQQWPTVLALLGCSFRRHLSYGRFLLFCRAIATHAFSVALQQRSNRSPERRCQDNRLPHAMGDMKARPVKPKRESRSGGIDLFAPIQDSTLSSAIPNRVLVSVPFAVARELQAKHRRRRKRWLKFAILELCACALFVIFLVLGTSEGFVGDDFTLPFEIAVLVAASAVALLPVIFYGSTRPKYRTRRDRCD